MSRWIDYFIKKCMVPLKKMKLTLKSRLLFNLQKNYLHHMMFPSYQTTFIKTFLVTLIPREIFYSFQLNETLYN